MASRNVRKKTILVDKSSFLWKTYTALFQNKPFKMTEEDLLKCAKVELRLKLETFPPVVRQNLPAILIAFMNKWSGWQFSKIFIETLPLSDEEARVRFLRFKKFLLFKFSTLKSGDGLEILDKRLEKIATCSQTISIKCPPHITNSLVFTIQKDDIIMDFTQPIVQLKSPSTTQLINLPHVQVSFKTEDMYFFRRQVTEYTRYLNYDQSDLVPIQNLTIEHAEQLSKSRNCYSYAYVQCYVKQYLGMLRQLNVPKKKLEEIQVILQQFLQDIDYIDINRSIATNTYVRFFLSKYPYMSSEKVEAANLPGKDSFQMALYEVFSPKIEMALLLFSASQLRSSKFQYIQQLEEKFHGKPFNRSCMPKIEYKCIFCNVVYQDFFAKEAMIRHIITHKYEKQVWCSACRTRFDGYTLASNRWHHKCSPKVD